MGIAQVCMRCGTALTRVRPIREPRYGLRLVLCPKCGAAGVKRRHPIQQSWRTSLRVQRSVCTLLLQIVLLAGLVMGSVGSISGLADSPSNLTDMLRHDKWALAGPGVALPLLVGIWLTVGLGHWPRGSAWAVWAGLLTCLLAIEPILDAPGPPAVEVFGLTAIPGSFDMERWLRRLLILAVMLAIATGGIPIGRLLRGLHEKNRRARFRKRRARLRAKMVGT